jgi:hypothetical protein
VADHRTGFWLQYGDVWHDVTTDVRQNEVAVTRGGAEASDAPKANTVSLTFGDRAGVYRPHDPNSPLYGLAGRNTPLMIGSLIAYEDFEDTTIVVTIGAGAGVNPWARSTTSPHTGSWCLQSGATADGAVSDAVIDFPTGANVCTLWYRTDCSTTDLLTISTGGRLRVTASGTGGTWQKITVPAMANSVGAKQVYVRYAKDASGSAGSDAVFIDDIQFFRATGFGEASSWAPDRTVGFVKNGRGDQWTDVDAAGLLQRLGNWSADIQSAYTRSILQYFTHLLGLWTGEDGSLATAMGNALSGGAMAPATGVTFGNDESPLGGDTSMQLSATSSVSGQFAGSTDDTAWQIGFAFKLPAVPPTDTGALLSWRTNDGSTWSITCGPTQYGLQGFDSTGAVLVNFLSLFGGGGSPNQWLLMRMQVSVSGGTATWALTWYAQNATTTLGVGGTYAASTVGHPVSWTVTGNTVNTGGWIGYILGTTGMADNLLGGNIIAGFNGWSGETAVTRFGRLMFEAGLSPVIRGIAKPSEAMGPQRTDTFLDLLKEVRDTDGGILSDFEGMAALIYRCRTDLYAQTPKLALIYGVHVAPPLKPILDDLHTANLVTVTNRNGSSATVEDTTSIMSTQPPPNGVGQYKIGVGVNATPESRLPQLAAWRRAIGTNPSPRYSSVTIDLDATPSLEASIEDLTLGDRITISGLDPDLIDLMVIGVQDVRADQKRRTATLLCVSYRVYDVAIYQTSGATITSAMKRYDSKTSTLNAGYTASATTMVVTFTDRLDAWSTTSVPYSWAVAGERITVTAMGAVTGTGPYTQSATVTRAVNGVSKAQTSGTAVHMHPDQQARYAL